jgi:hypothetical protein
MDELGLNLFRPYNIILVAQSRKKGGKEHFNLWNHDLGFSNIFFFERICQLLEVVS